MKKFFSLVYRNEGEEPKRLYENSDLTEVEKKKIDFSFEYNSSNLFIEELGLIESDIDEKKSSSVGKGFIATLLASFGLALVLVANNYKSK